MSFKKIGVIGLGLMGGSIVKRLQRQMMIVVADKPSLSFLELVDVVILAVPIPAILEVAAEIAHLKNELTQPLAVIDIGSVKGAIAKKFEAFTDGTLEFVATHPMAGKEKNGFEHSDPTLFEGASWIVTPHAKNTAETLNNVDSLILSLGAQPFRMNPEDHDRKAALISHMPYLVSKALLEFVTKEDPAALMMGGPGFRSMTRLAHDNPEMWRDISENNRENMAAALEKFAAFLREKI